MKTEQSLMLKLAENQLEMKPILARLAEGASHSAIDDQTRQHIRNMDGALHRLVDEMASGRDEMVREIRSEFKLLARTSRPWPRMIRARRLAAARPARDIEATMPMARRRGGRGGINIWPGFVDALASLLLVIIFVLLAFVLTQFYLGQVLSGRDQTISRLSRQLNDLTDLLDIERRSNAELKVNIGRLTEQLGASTGERDQLQAQLNQTGTDRQQVALLQHDVDALKALKEELEKKLASMGAQAGDAQGQLAQERKLSEEARAEAALLHQQMEAMRQELARITVALDASENLSSEQKVQISDLGKRLNAALASKVEDWLAIARSFFGRLRKVLGDRPGIRIEGDRFIFQSELLFASGSAELGVDGQTS